MNRLYLVRHARTRIDPTLHQTEWALDPAGEEQLQALAALADFGSAYRIVSSSEPKAVRTAEAIATAHGLPGVERMDQLRELYKRAYVADHAEAMTRLFQFPDQPAHEGWETAADALARLTAAIDELVQAARGQDLIVVSHGTILSLYIAHLQGQDRVDPANWAAVGMPDLCTVDTESMRMVQPFGAWRQA